MVHPSGASCTGLNKVLTEQKDNIKFGLELFPYGGTPIGPITLINVPFRDGNSAVVVGVGWQGLAGPQPLPRYCQPCFRADSLGWYTHSRCARSGVWLLRER